MEPREQVDSPPPIYGIDLPPDEHRLLRGRPPARALQWAASFFGLGARVHSVRPLAGGTASAIHALAIEDGAGQMHRVVLRRYVRPDLLVSEPYLGGREATALRFVAGSSLPTPILLATDLRAELADAPALLMTRVLGHIEWQPRDLETYLARLAEPLPQIHAIPVPGDPAIPPYDPYVLEMRRPPRWASDPTMWWKAIEVFESPPPVVERCFIHRDYHPGNVLWSRGRVTSIVDWGHASIGSPYADVGHCRVNLAYQFGQEAADRFLTLYKDLTGRREYHPYWDIVAAIGGMDESLDDEPNPSDERFLARAVAQL